MKQIGEGSLEMGSDTDFACSKNSALPPFPCIRLPPGLVLKHVANRGLQGVVNLGHVHLLTLGPQAQLRSHAHAAATLA